MDNVAEGRAWDALESRLGGKDRPVYLLRSPSSFLPSTRWKERVDVGMWVQWERSRICIMRRVRRIRIERGELRKRTVARIRPPPPDCDMYACLTSSASHSGLISPIFSHRSILSSSRPSRPSRLSRPPLQLPTIEENGRLPHHSQPARRLRPRSDLYALSSPPLTLVVTDSVLPLLTSRGLTYKIHETDAASSGSGSIARAIMADRSDPTRVIVAGGDGTAHELIDGVLSSGSGSGSVGRWDLVVLPLGTVSCFPFR